MGLLTRSMADSDIFACFWEPCSYNWVASSSLNMRVVLSLIATWYAIFGWYHKRPALFYGNWRSWLGGETGWYVIYERMSWSKQNKKKWLKITERIIEKQSSSGTNSKQIDLNLHTPIIHFSFCITNVHKASFLEQHDFMTSQYVCLNIS